MFKKSLLFTPSAVGTLVLLTLALLTSSISSVRVEGSDGGPAELSAARPASDPSPVPESAPAPTGVEVTREEVAPPKEHVKAPRGTELVFNFERRLNELGYWTGPVDGILDPASRSAVMAFQKVEGLERTGRLTAAELAVLLEARPPVPLESGYPHVEVDIARQVLFFVDANGRVSHVLPVSTGNGKSYSVKGVRDVAYTPRGRCTVYRKIAGERVAPLGSIYYPNYLVGGIAIHGSPSVPARPASHGCVRIPMWSCRSVSALTPVGTVVLVHDGGSFANDRRWLQQVARYTPANFNASMAVER
jgi:hypothetical protein